MFNTDLDSVILSPFTYLESSLGGDFLGNSEHGHEFRLIYIRTTKHRCFKIFIYFFKELPGSENLQGSTFLPEFKSGLKKIYS